MSNQVERYKHSKRLQRKSKSIKKQTRIVRELGLEVNHNQPHRYSKHHALNCGRPHCLLCCNPRRIFNKKTIQEESFEQTKNWSDD